MCASCIHIVPSVAAKYCSDFTYRGICGYRDADFFCTCDEDSLDKPQDERDRIKRIMTIATTQGACIFDKVSLSVTESHALHLVISCLESLTFSK